MIEIEQLLEGWQVRLCQNLNSTALLSKNPIAFKYKALHRCIMIRECVLWRTHDLLTQAHILFSQNHILGSRILIRSALETSAILIYLNQEIERVLEGQLSFHEFSDKTSKLSMGSRNKTTEHTSINIVTILEKCNKKYLGILDSYNTLSEDAHPNFEGLSFGYSRVDIENCETRFGNFWHLRRDCHESLVDQIAKVVESEYNDVWTKNIKELEKWLTEHDTKLKKIK